MDLLKLRSAAAPLIAESGITGEVVLRPLRGGANNRVFRVEAGTARVLLKVYFQHREDTRDRLGAEFAFAQFAWAHGIRSIPQPLARDDANRLGLFEFVEGQHVRPEEVDADAIRHALTFYHALNLLKKSPSACRLTPASEACFCFSDHLSCVGNRVGRLHRIDPVTAIDREALVFIKTDLADAWENAKNCLLRSAADAQQGWDRPLEHHNRCLSPSDFGFHNAVRTSDGRLRFFDFEYAGWDDPARMVADFFCQQAVPVPMDYFESFAAEVSSDFPLADSMRRRMDLLLPIYQVKWCCILLNDFQREGALRRQFAGGGADSVERKVLQLAKARRLLEAVCSIAK